MSVNTSNAYGKISISDLAIAKIASHTAMECYGIVEMVSRRFTDSLSELLKKDIGGREQNLYRRLCDDEVRRFVERRRRILEGSDQIQGGKVHGDDRGHGKRKRHRGKTVKAMRAVFGCAFFPCDFFHGFLLKITTVF